MVRIFVVYNNGPCAGESENVETTFTSGNTEDTEAGFNSRAYRQFDNNS